jgi:hypothetical protein
MKPIKVDDVDMAFGGGPGAMGKLLPAYTAIPDEFRRGHTPFNRLVDKWFFSGLEKKALKVKGDIDESAAWRHMKTIMGSFEPKHEHKTAGVAYLMSQWFDLADSTPAQRREEHG